MVVVLSDQMVALGWAGGMVGLGLGHEDAGEHARGMDT